MNTFGIPGSGWSYRTDPYGPDRRVRRLLQSGSGRRPRRVDRFEVFLWIIGLIVLAALLFGKGG